MKEAQNNNIQQLEYINSLKNYMEKMDELSYEADKKLKLIATFEEYFKCGLNLIGKNILSNNEEKFLKDMSVALENLKKQDIEKAMKIINSITEKNEKITMSIRYYIQDYIYKNNIYKYKLSICMIVKNEEKNIDRCLKSLKPLVENNLAEIIIVDTGSTDNTVEIAKKYTEKVYFHPWRDSFSEARNWSISLATGEYVFIVDGDDEIKESEIEKIIHEFSIEDYKKYNTFSVKVKSYLDINFETFTTITQNHIFKNDGSLYYSGSVHNQPYSALPLKNLDITITHYGYIMTPELSERKFNRTVPLLLKELEICTDIYKEMYYRYQLSVSYGVHGDLDKALDEVEFLFNKIKQIKFDTTYLVYINNAALIYKGVELFDKVLEVCDLGLKYQNDFIDLVYIKSETLFITKQYEKAVKWLKEYLDLSKEFSNHEIYNDTRFSFYHLESQEKALKMLALSYIKIGKNVNTLLNFNSSCEYFNFAEECVKVNAYIQAIDCYKLGLKLDVNNYNGYNNLAHLLNVIGKNDEANYYYKEALKHCDNEDKIKIYSDYLLSLNYNSSYTNQDIFFEHKKYEDILSCKDIKFNVSEHTFRPHKKLRIGYLSADFRQHPVMYFIAAPIVGHNKESFELYCYSDTEKIDDVTKGLQNYIKNWRDISKMIDYEVEKLIKEDEIDILIDLGGHTGKNRLTVFAKKPAPVQITWIGYPNTTGLNTMDYRITDFYADPLGESDKYYTEKLIRMPKSFLCYSAAEFPKVEGIIPYKRNKKITFGSFNNFTKVTEDAIRVWSEILKKVKKSTLILKSEIFEDKVIEKETLKRFEKYGVDKEQIQLLPSDKKFNDRLNRNNNVDIALDTYPYNGTTTTCEAMYMGVPVITLAGNRHVSRVGVSLLTNVGLNELIAYNEEEYIQKAVSLANDLKRLEKIKTELRGNIIKSSIMKADDFVSELEELYKTIWKSYCDDNSIVYSGKDNSKEEINKFKIQVKGQIEKHINNGELENANILIKEYEAIIKNDLEIYSMKAVIEIMNNNLRLAEEILRDGLSIDSDNYDLLYNMSYVQEMLGNKELSSYFKKQANMTIKKIEDNNADFKLDDKNMDDILNDKYGNKLEEIESNDLKKYSILIGSPIKQKPEILKEFLNSLKELRVKNSKVDFYFVDDNDLEKSTSLLKEFELPMSEVKIVEGNKEKKYVCTELSHEWKEELIWKVAAYKDKIIEYAKQKKYDFLFLIDSDLVLSPNTLEQLMSAKKDIISEIFWTKLDLQSFESPQVWVSGNYDLYYKNKKEFLTEQEKESRIKGYIKCMRIPGIYEVGGLGACTLISKNALDRNVNFQRIKDYDYIGEDRHFCERARKLGIKLYVDTHNPAYHIYRESELSGVKIYKNNCLKKLIYEYDDFTRTKVKAKNNKVTLSMLVRNEGDRYLKKVLKNALNYIDEAVILDDGSDDNTVDICREILKDIPHTIVSNKTSGFHNEINLRKQQWELTIKTNPEWILCLDADEIFEDKFKYEIKNLIDQPYYDYFSFRLYDFWDENHYREDNYWKAHSNYRTFLVRYQPAFKYIWQETSQHCGRLPINIYKLPGAISRMRIKHYGWAKEEDRKEKYERYMKLDREGKNGDLDQYKSILDKEPNLIEWEE